MTKKEKPIILVVYVGIFDTDVAYTKQYICEIEESLNKSRGMFGDEDIVMFIVPDYNDVGIRIECLNPVFVSEAEFNEIEIKLKETKKKLDKYLDE
ncbi:MAG: hypothetical protein H8E98_02550 [Bacteroidetes bacterium]|nr:hypothetical protein [Bacteroidota bacterium]